MSRRFAFLVLLVVLIGLAFVERRTLITNISALTESGESPPLLITRSGKPLDIEEADAEESETA